MAKKYPGDTASPVAVADYFAEVAIDEYAVPGILPVMTSCVELTDAWTGPGDVKQVPGYLSAIDHWSVGYFQQQYDGNPSGVIFGWGTYDQLIDAEYALHRFLQEAVKFKDWEWHENTTDPDALGRWCQAIQRSGVPDAYRDKGYAMAQELLQGYGNDDAADEYPTMQVYEAQGGWLYVKDAMGNAFWLRGAAVNDKAKTDKDRWYFAPGNGDSGDNGDNGGVTVCTWPVANDSPTSGNYQDRHPTRYVWRKDVGDWACWLVQNYDVWCNTYYDHPEGYARDETSFDVWGPAGRNDPVDPTIGQEIFDLLFNYEGKPDIDWIIWQRWIWTYYGGWKRFGSEPFDWHDDHIHVTYF